MTTAPTPSRALQRIAPERAVFPLLSPLRATAELGVVEGLNVLCLQ